MKRFLFLFILLLPLASAHLDGGQDIIQDQYIIDFGYSSGTIEEGTSNTLAFNLIDKETEEPIPFDSAWVRISNENVIFAGTFAQQADHINFAYTFPKGGDHGILVRFSENGETITEQTFTVHVEKNAISVWWYILGIILFLVLIKIHKKPLQKIFLKRK